MWQDEINNLGFAIMPDVLRNDETASALVALSKFCLPRSKAGIRHMLSDKAVAALARDHRLMTIACNVHGSDAVPFHATLFDKSPNANWLVVWHQDTALPLQKKNESAGWGPWSVKQGVIYAHAPACALEKVLALRIHLDDSTLQNGPLRILPGTHEMGVLSDNSIEQAAMRIAATDCVVPGGGILAMRPLVIHASSKSQVPQPRRVLHIEYGASLAIAEGIQLAEA
jgi:ectoine hydroxylase-related dioxygenase (phytanoyl-CoA dioxygenase family)